MADPLRPGCVVLSIGLVHMGSQGRIVEACGSELTPVFSQKLEPPQPRPDEIIVGGGGEVPFFGVAPDGAGGLWAIAPDGLYRIRSGKADRLPIPKPTQIGVIWISDLGGRTLAIWTHANQQFSLSGSTPLLVIDQKN